MTSLRLRLALLIIVAISAVVALATLVSVLVLGDPGPRVLRPIAVQVRTISELAEARFGGAAPDRPALLANPMGGERLDLTDQLLTVLQEQGSTIRPLVTRPQPGGDPVISIPVGNRGWIALPYSDFPPPGQFWGVLTAWMVLIVVGMVAVALFAASRMTRPLLMLERAVANVGPDGMLPPLAETGPPEMRQTAATLNNLSARLKQSMESRMRLVAAAGHDLRTPMTRMRLRVEFLDDDEREKWLADLDELDRIADSAIRLVREEIDADNAEPIALDRLVVDLGSELLLVGHKLTLGPIDPARIVAGPLAIKRALQNLVVNAATHGGGATVSLATDSSSATVIIEDNGPGIPPALLDRVFEPFFRVDPARRQSVPGAGLGLAIAREIVERYGGSISIENRQPQGLRQKIKFPRSLP